MKDLLDYIDLMNAETFLSIVEIYFESEDSKHVINKRKKISKQIEELKEKLLESNKESYYHASEALRLRNQEIDSLRKQHRALMDEGDYGNCQICGTELIPISCPDNKKGLKCEFNCPDCNAVCHFREWSDRTVHIYYCPQCDKLV